MTALIIAVALIVAAGILALAYVIAAKRQAGPTRELAKAMRLLDRILAYDDVATSLSTELRDEAKAITRNYFKELG